jgi:hypothetical protein
MRGLLPAGNENFVLMDSTYVMSASERLGINAKGYNGAGDFGKHFRLMYLFQAKVSGRSLTARRRNNPVIDYRPVSRKDFKKAGGTSCERDGYYDMSSAVQAAMNAANRRILSLSV